MKKPPQNGDYLSSVQNWLIATILQPSALGPV